MQSNGKMQRESFVNWLTPSLKLAITFRARKCAMMTERADAFSGPGCGCTRLDTLNCFDRKEIAEVLSHLCGSFRDFSSRIMHQRVQSS